MLDVGVALGESCWPRPFVPGCPHPSPLPPSGRGDGSIEGMCAWWMGVLSGGFGGVGLLEGTLGLMSTAGAQVGVCNVPNRTIFEGDNLDVMRGMNDGCVDLIYLDPPFNSNRDYAASIGSKATGAGAHCLLQRLTVDHVFARLKGGADHLGGLQLL